MIPYATAERAHAGDRIARPLTEDRARAVDAVLNVTYGIRLRPETDFFGVVHLHPTRPVTTVEEVRLTAVLLAVTDSPLAWPQAGPEGEVVWG